MIVLVKVDETFSTEKAAENLANTLKLLDLGAKSGQETGEIGEKINLAFQYYFFISMIFLPKFGVF